MCTPLSKASPRACGSGSEARRLYFIRYTLYVEVSPAGAAAWRELSADVLAVTCNQTAARAAALRGAALEIEVVVTRRAPRAAR